MQTHGRGTTDQGKTRARNEDDWLADDELGLYVVCDGMGGHNAGDVAARQAVDAIASAVTKERDQLQAIRDGEGSPEDLERIVRGAIRHACATIFENSYSSPRFRGMGCAATALLVAGEHAALGHVGDARLYLVRRGRPHQLTRDHTIASEMLEAGRAEPGDKRLDQFRRVLTRAVGTFRTVDVDTAPIFLLPGDHLVLCTDGGWTGPGGERRLASLLSSAKPDRVADAVIADANAAGGEDNTTVVVVTVGGEDLHPRDAESVDKAIRALGKSTLFGTLSYRQRNLVVAAGSLTRYREGSTVIESGDTLAEAMVVVDGSLELDGTSTRYGPGNTVAWSRLSTGPAPSQGTVRAQQPTLVLALGHDALRSLAWRRPWLGLSLYQALSARSGRGEVDPL